MVSLMRSRLTIFLFVAFIASSCSRSDVAEKRSEKEAISIYLSAYSKYQSGDYTNAITECTEAIKIEPNFANPFLIRGMAKHALQDYDGAIADYTKAIELNPKYSYAYAGRADAKASLKDYNEAMADFNKAIELDSTNTDYYNTRGITKRILGDYTGALVDYNKIIELSPQSAYSYNNRGYDKLCLKDYTGAISDFNKVIEFDSKIVESHVGIGEAKRALKDYDGAIAAFEKAIQLDPKCIQAYKCLGFIENDLHQFRAALTDLNKALALDPTQLDIQNRIYLIRMQLGEQKEVTEELAEKFKYQNFENKVTALFTSGATGPIDIKIQSFLAGVLSENELLRTATNAVESPKIQNARLREVYYYAGMKRLIAGDKNGTADFFQKYIDVGTPNYGEQDYDEYSSVEAELHALEK